MTWSTKRFYVCREPDGTFTVRAPDRRVVFTAPVGLRDAIRVSQQRNGFAPANGLPHTYAEQIRVAAGVEQ